MIAAGMVRVGRGQPLRWQCHYEEVKGSAMPVDMWPAIEVANALHRLANAAKKEQEQHQQQLQRRGTNGRQHSAEMKERR